MLYIAVWLACHVDVGPWDRRKDLALLLLDLSGLPATRILLRADCRPLADHSDRTYVHQSLSPRRQHTQPTYFWSKRPSLNSLNTLKRCSLAVSKSGLTKVKQQDYVSLDKSPPSYFVEGIWKVKLAATIMQLELLYTPSQKYLYLLTKVKYIPLKGIEFQLMHTT